MTALPALLQTVPTGLINRLMNGDCLLNPEGTETGADGSTCFVTYTRLSQSNSIQTSQLTAPEAGQSRAMRVTQANASSQLMGIAQTIASVDCQDLRTAPLSLSFRAKISYDTRVMFALLSWNGTADASDADPINDWTSTSYIPGQFFKSTFEVISYGYLAMDVAEWTSAPYIPFFAPDDMNNLVFVVWTEETAAQNATLDLGLMQVIEGATQLAFEHRPYQLEVAMQYEASEEPFVDIASASTVNLGVALSNNIRLTGTTTVTSFGTAASGLRFLIRTASALTITHNASAILCPGGVNLTTFANFTFEVISLGSGVWLILSPQAVLARGTTTALSLQDRFPTFDVRNFGCALDGTTDDTSGYQAAINACNTAYLATGIPGCVYHPRGIALTTTLTWKSGCYGVGDQRGTSEIKLKNSTNADLILGQDAVSLWGGSTTGGLQDYGFSQITLNGNRANNSSGNCLRIYGRAPQIDGLYIKDTPDKGFYHKWGLPTGPTLWGVEAVIRNVYIDTCGEECFYWEGPNDSQVSDLFCVSGSQSGDNTYDNIVITGAYANIRAARWHSWRWNPVGGYVMPRYAIRIEANTCEFDLCHFEGGYTASVYLDAQFCAFTDTCKFYAVRNGGATFILRDSHNTIKGHLLGPYSGSCYGLVLGMSGDAPDYNLIELNIIEQCLGAIDFTFDGGNNRVIGRGINSTGTFIVGAAASTTCVDLGIKGSGGGTYRLESYGLDVQTGDLVLGPIGPLTATGTNQGTAVTLDGGESVYIFGTVAASTGGILEVATAAGKVKVVVNNGANTLSVYPAVGGSIAGNGVNNPQALAAGKSLILISTSATAWAVVLGA